MRKLILLIILVNTALFNMCFSQGFPIRTGGTPINYEYLTEFDSTLLNRRLTKIDRFESSAHYNVNGEYSGGTTSSYYEISFAGTNKLLSSKNKALLGEYMSVYPESKKAFKHYKAWRTGSRIGYPIFFAGTGIALYAALNDEPELNNRALIASVSVLAICAVTTIMHKRKLNNLVNVYNKAGGFKEYKLE